MEGLEGALVVDDGGEGVGDLAVEAKISPAKGGVGIGQAQFGPLQMIG